MEITEILNNKKQYMPLLLIGDEQADMIEKYIDKGRMFVIKDSAVKAVCVVTDEGNGVLEIKNIAVYPEYQKQGLGKMLIEFIAQSFSKEFKYLQAGTGDSPLTVPFYEHCGFTKSHVIKNFFVDNYDQPIIEAGKQLVDMVYFVKQM